jgi:hypothetical protein
MNPKNKSTPPIITTIALKSISFSFYSKNYPDSYQNKKREEHPKP